MLKKAHWPNTSIHTVPSLRRKHQRLDRQRTSAASVINQMKRGGVLRLTYERGKPIWSIGSTIIPDNIARVVRADHRVADVGDALFKGMPGQIFRYAEA